MKTATTMPSDGPWCDHELRFQSLFHEARWPSPRSGLYGSGFPASARGNYLTRARRGRP